MYIIVMTQKGCHPFFSGMYLPIALKILLEMEITLTLSQIRISSLLCSVFFFLRFFIFTFTIISSEGIGGRLCDSNKCWRHLMDCHTSGNFYQGILYPC